MAAAIGATQRWAHGKTVGYFGQDPRMEVNVVVAVEVGRLAVELP